MLTKYLKKIILLPFKLEFQMYSLIKRSSYSTVRLIFHFTNLWHHDFLISIVYVQAFRLTGYCQIC
jgi:hypothetical protein